MRRIGVFACLFIALSSLAHAQFSLSPGIINFTTPLGTSPQFGQSFTITNTSGSGQNLRTTAASEGNWLIATPGVIPLNANSQSPVTVLVSSSSLPAGSYVGTVTVASSSFSQSVTVNLTVTIAFTANPQSFDLSAGAGTAPSNVSFTVMNTSGNDLALSFGATTKTGGNWLSVGTSALTLPAGQMATIPATVDPSHLGAAMYSGTITVQGGGLTTPIPVTLQVNGVNIAISPSVLSITVTAGQKIQSPPMTMSVSGGGSVALQITATGAGLSAPAVQVSAPNQFTITVDASNLRAGSYSGAITFSCAASSNCLPQVVAVTVTVIGADAFTLDASQLSFPGTNAGGTQAANLTNGSGSSLSIAITATSQGNWLSASIQPNPVAVAGTAVITVSADASSLTAGDYSGSLSIAGGGTTKGIVVKLQVGALLPVISNGGVVTASSFGGVSALGSGTYIEIYGTNLARTQQDWGTSFVNGKAPTSLGGVGVKVNGTDAFVNFVSASQVNALLPANISAGPGQITVTNSLGTSAPFIASFQALQPTLLAPKSFNIANKQYLGALFSDYSTFALPSGAIPGIPSRPAKPGEPLILFGLGFGSVNPDVAVGTVAPSQQTHLSLPFQILFGQTPAMVNYQGLVPQSTSLYQFNIVVPQIPDSDSVPVTFTLGGTTGVQTLYIAVHQ